MTDCHIRHANSAPIKRLMERLVLFLYDRGSRAGAVIESLADKHDFKGHHVHQEKKMMGQQ